MQFLNETSEFLNNLVHELNIYICKTSELLIRSKLFDFKVKYSTNDYLAQSIEHFEKSFSVYNDNDEIFRNLNTCINSLLFILRQLEKNAKEAQYYDYLWQVTFVIDKVKFLQNNLNNWGKNCEYKKALNYKLT